MKEKKLVLIDGNSYLHRAYHALPKLTDAKGNVVNAVFGFLKMLNKIIKREQPSHIAVAFDHRKPTFRHNDFEQYKAHRAEMESELSLQIPVLREVLKMMNIRYLDYEGFEADDIIASLARIAENADIPVTIITGDKDILQLVRDGIKVINGMKDIEFDALKVKEEMGVEPSQITDYLALTGDKSDNLPGVAGIGPVTARKLFERYNSLDDIYDHLAEIKDSVRLKLEKHKEDAYTTRRLAKLVENLDIPLTLDDCLWKGPDSAALKEKFKELNFKSLVSDWIEEDELRGEIHTSVIFEKDSLKQYLSENREKETAAMELVTAENERIVGLFISFDGENVAYVPVSHNYLGVEKQILSDELFEAFREEFSPGKPVIGYELKKLYKFFKAESVAINMSFDVITADYVLNSDTSGDTLKKICARYLSWAPSDMPSCPGEKNIREFAASHSNRITAVFRMKEILTKKMTDEKSLELFTDVEMKVLKILAEMEITGIKIDCAMMEKTEARFKEEMRAVEKEIFEIAGESFNVNSSQQLAVILFNKLKLEPVRKTKTGYSTAEDVLQQLKKENPLPGRVLRYRRLQKLLSTYIEPLPKKIDPDTGRLHTTFNIAGTATGRLSSSEPNLQNIPVKTHEGAMIRETFVPEEGNIFLSADYSQIDLRVLAHISGDSNLVESFKSGKDIHTRTAARLYDVPESEVTPEMRKRAKSINFGIVYGMSSWGLSKRADMDEEESKEFIEKYFERYPDVKNYMSLTIEKACRDRFVDTILNRRRYLNEINSKNGLRRKLAERMAINTPIQGSSADIIKLAMVKLDKKYDFNSGPVKLLLQIHDELLFELPEGMLPEAEENIRREMENACELSVPLEVVFRTGRNWKDIE